MNCHSLFPRDPLKGALHHELFNMGTSHSPTLLSETIKQYHGILMDPGLNDGLWAQRKIPSCLREELAVECGNEFFSLSRPMDLPVALQTEEWNNLILNCKRFKSLELPQRTVLVRLLTALGFQRYAIKELLEGVNCEASKINCSESCDYANALARARFLTYKEQGQGYLSSYSPEDYWEIINSPVEIKHKISPAFSLMLQYITEVPDPQRVGYLSDLIVEALESVDDVFNKSFLASIYHRGFAMLPAKKGDSEGIAYHMSRAEDLAHWCLCNQRSPYQKFIARENLYSVYESSIKAALQMEEKAHKYRELGTRLFELDSFDSRALMSAAESYVASGDLKLGADLYFRAVCCGSLYTAIAWYMAGQCYALLKRRELAAWCFLKSYENDNDAAAPVEDLLELKLAGTSFDAWARMTK